jgi:hypothetical protein
MASRDLSVPVGGEYQQSKRRVGVAEIPQQLQTCRVRPLHVIENQHDRPLPTDVPQQTNDRREEPKTVGLSVAALRDLQIGEPSPECRNHPCEIRSAHCDVRAQVVLIRVRNQMTDGFHEQAVGRGQVFLRMTEQHTCPSLERRPGHLGDERRLAQTRLT